MQSSHSIAFVALVQAGRICYELRDRAARASGMALRAGGKILSIHGTICTSKHLLVAPVHVSMRVEAGRGVSNTEVHTVHRPTGLMIPVAQTACMFDYTTVDGNGAVLPRTSEPVMCRPVESGIVLGNTTTVIEPSVPQLRTPCTISHTPGDISPVMPSVTCLVTPPGSARDHPSIHGNISAAPPARDLPPSTSAHPHILLLYPGTVLHICEVR